MTWTGAAANGDWDLTSDNWTDVPGGTPAVTRFLDGDYVKFNDAVGGTVAIDGDAYLAGTPAPTPGETETITNIITTTESMTFDAGMFDAATALKSQTAVDFQKAWIDGFTEAAADVPQLSVAKSDLSQTVLRIGLNSKYTASDRLNLRTRLQYGVQVGGASQGRALTSLAANPGESRMLAGVNLGRNMLNVGLGGEWKLTNRTRIFGDYDFDLGEKSTAHTGQFGFVTNW